MKQYSVCLMRRKERCSNAVLSEHMARRRTLAVLHRMQSCVGRKDVAGWSGDCVLLASELGLERNRSCDSTLLTSKTVASTFCVCAASSGQAFRSATLRDIIV